MIVEAPSPLYRRNRRRLLAGRLRGLVRPSARCTPETPVVFCYDLLEGESLADWCRRNPRSAPPPDAERVVWILPDTPLPRLLSTTDRSEA